ncbi:unnamed protein product, partial [Ectocarpus fasciculatus]
CAAGGTVDEATLFLFELGLKTLINYIVRRYSAACTSSHRGIKDSFNHACMGEEGRGARNARITGHGYIGTESGAKNIGGGYAQSGSRERSWCVRARAKS